MFESLAPAPVDKYLGRVVEGIGEVHLYVYPARKGKRCQLVVLKDVLFIPIWSDESNSGTTVGNLAISSNRLQFKHQQVKSKVRHTVSFTDDAGRKGRYVVKEMPPHSEQYVLSCCTNDNHFESSARK